MKPLPDYGNNVVTDDIPICDATDKPMCCFDAQDNDINVPSEKCTFHLTNDGTIAHDAAIDDLIRNIPTDTLVNSTSDFDAAEHAMFCSRRAMHDAFSKDDAHVASDEQQGLISCLFSRSRNDKPKPPAPVTNDPTESTHEDKHALTCAVFAQLATLPLNMDTVTYPLLPVASICSTKDTVFPLITTVLMLSLSKMTSPFAKDCPPTDHAVQNMNSIPYSVPCKSKSHLNKVIPTPTDFNELRPYFGWSPRDIIARTWKCATQFAKHHFHGPPRRHINSRYPQLNKN